MGNVRVKHFIFLFILICGCVHPNPPTTKWDIILTSPNGEVVKTYTVDSSEKPRYKKKGFSSVGCLIDDGYSSYRDWEKDIVIPASWLVEVKEHQDAMR